MKQFAHNKGIRAHISNLEGIKDLNSYITVTFARGLYGPLRRKHVEDARRMVSAYAKKLSSKLYGRERRFSKKRVPLIAWAEDKNRFGDPCPLHYHILCEFPSERDNELKNITETYWRRVGAESPHQVRPDVDIRQSYDSTGCANYNMKHISSGLALEYMVIAGFDFDLG